MSDCPCCSNRPFDQCCKPIIDGSIPAPDPEALMRSRYTAYTLANVDYLKESTHPDDRADFDPEATRDWAENSQWRKLEINDIRDGGPEDDQGTVEFIAFFNRDGVDQKHHEQALFKKMEGRWYFSDGEPVKPRPVRRATPKVGRNAPCPCGSGKKYKKCCG